METVGGENGGLLSGIFQGVLTVSLTTADGKTKTIKGCEDRDRGIKYEFLHDLVPCNLKSLKN